MLSRRHRVVRYDLLGHGRSDDPFGPRQANDFVEQFLEVLDFHDLEGAMWSGCRSAVSSL